REQVSEPPRKGSGRLTKDPPVHGLVPVAGEELEDADRGGVWVERNRRAVTQVYGDRGPVRRCPGLPEKAHRHDFFTVVVHESWAQVGQINDRVQAGAPRWYRGSRSCRPGGIIGE